MRHVNIINGLLNTEETGKPVRLDTLNRVGFTKPLVQNVIKTETERLNKKYYIDIGHHNKNYEAVDMNRSTPIEGTAIAIANNNDGTSFAEKILRKATINSIHALGTPVTYENLSNDSDKPLVVIETEGIVLGQKEIGGFLEKFYKKVEKPIGNQRIDSLVIRDVVKEAIYKESAKTALNENIVAMEESDFITLPENNPCTASKYS